MNRSREKVTLFLKSYQDRLSIQNPIVDEHLTVPEICDMVKFYLSVVKPLARHYTSWALDNLARKTNEPWRHTPLSDTEETRLMRALYRFQLCCNVFGISSHPSYEQPRLGFDSVDILTIFIGIYEPWEVEEIGCIYTFAEATYSQIFEDIRWDVNEENPKFDGQRPPTPEGAFDLGNAWVRDSILKGTISRGLELLHFVCFTIENHEQLVSTMQEQMSLPIGNFLGDETLGKSAQFAGRHDHPSDRDLKQERRDPLPWNGDEIRDREGLHPPLGWTLIWRGTCSNIYGVYVPGDLCRWGYVIWDAARLEDTDTREILLQTFDAQWGGDDPRDYLL